MREAETPVRRVGARTLVFDPATSRQVVWLEGVHVLPPGSIIELDPGDAVVDRIRLLAGPQADVCLDCTVPATYWDAHPAFVED